MNENVQGLFEMGKIEAPTEELARDFCRASKNRPFEGNRLEALYEAT